MHPLVQANIIQSIIIVTLIIAIVTVLWYARPVLGVIKGNFRGWDTLLIRGQNNSVTFMPGKYKNGAFELKNGIALLWDRPEPMYITGARTRLFIVDDQYGIVTKPSFVSAFNAVKNRPVEITYVSDDKEVTEQIIIRSAEQFFEIKTRLEMDIQELEDKLSNIMDEKLRKTIEKELEEARSKYNGFMDAVVEIPRLQVLRLSDIAEFARNKLPIPTLQAYVDEEVLDVTEDLKKGFDFNKLVALIMTSAVAVFIVMIGYLMLSGGHLPSMPSVPSMPAPGGGQVIPIGRP